MCLSFPSTFCPPGSHCCLDLPSLPLSTSSTISRCFLTLVYSCICEGFPSCSSHIPLFLLCGYMLRREIFLGIVILAMNFQGSRVTLPSSKFISLSEGLSTCTVMSRIKSAISVFLKNPCVNSFSATCESRVNSDVRQRISATIIQWETVEESSQNGYPNASKPGASTVMNGRKLVI